MIKFALQCSNGHAFEAWFPDSDSFADQKARGFVTCPTCNDAAVEKTLMAPNVRGGRGRGRGGADVSAPLSPTDATTPDQQSPARQGPASPQAATTRPQAWSPEQVAAARQFLHSVRATVEQTHEDVGDKFADEARAIHEGTKPDRGIRGKASREQVDALLDDGLDVLPLPDLKLDG